MEKSTESLIWQVAVGVGTAVAGFFAALKRLRSLPREINGYAAQIANLEADMKRLIAQLKRDAEIAENNYKDMHDDVIDRIRRNADEIRDVKHRLRKLEGGSND